MQDEDVHHPAVAGVFDPCTRIASPNISSGESDLRPESGSPARRLISPMLFSFVILAIFLTASMGQPETIWLEAKDSPSCIFLSGNPFDVSTRPCDSTPDGLGRWKVVPRGTFEGHALWELTEAGTGRCLGWAATDTEAGRPVAFFCAQNADNIWEVFRTGSPSDGSIMLKSFGAWKSHGGRHECLARGPGNSVGFRICQAGDVFQQWHGVRPS
jgi:hypothetical protein